MTDAHQIVAIAAVVTTVGLLAAAVWSFVGGRRRSGSDDHRFAVDRMILATTAVIAVNGVLGVVLVVTGSRPADGLHLLYGPVALGTPAIGWWIGGRRRSRGGGFASRSRRDAWIVVASIVLLGVELRLFATG